jgi:hypothetical protein
LINHYTVIQLDKEVIIKDRVKTYKGKVPCVKVVAQGQELKKDTVIIGLEPFQIDLEEI